MTKTNNVHKKMTKSLTSIKLKKQNIEIKMI